MRRWMSLFFCAALYGPVASAKCVRIFYDGPTHGKGAYGKLLATFLGNLVGHFPNVTMSLSSVKKYEKGQIDACESSIFLSVSEGQKPPKLFLQEFTDTDKRVAWVGYNVQKLGKERIKKIWNASYAGKSQLNPDHADPEGKPGFFRYYDYKGETFFKRLEKDEHGEYQADDVSLLKLLDKEADSSKVVSWMRHSGTKERFPYILRNGNHWFVADLPFSRVHEEDRYLVFADVLFDILDEKPLHKDHLALVRFEDMSPAIPPRQMKALADAAQAESVPFVVSVIPIYRDPRRTFPLEERPKFVAALKEAEAKGGTLIMHGATHQSDDYPNPEGASAVDYEFWDVTKQKAMANDSTERAVGRPEMGLAAMNDVGLAPAAWVTPHYMASPLDNLIFAELFDWIIGRVMYTTVAIRGTQHLPAALRLNRSKSDKNGERLQYFASAVADTGDGPPPEGQFFPYEIYRDAYGGSVLPENIGYLRPEAEDGEPPESIDDMIRILKRNRVLRDAWGSLYLHPHIPDAPENGGIGEHDGDTREIRRLFQTAKDLGYHFVDVKAWVKAHPRP